MRKALIFTRHIFILFSVVMLLSSSLSYAADGGKGGSGGCGPGGDGSNGRDGSRR